MIQGGFAFDEGLFTDKERIGSSLKGCYLNDLRLLQTDKMLWVRLAVSGSPPLPRFGHTLNISGSNIVMFGGWSNESNNRENEENGKENDEELGYLKILNVDNFLWENSKFRRRAPQCRYGHTATSVGPHVLIFGGWEFNRATNDIYILRHLESPSK